jgi:hypothetical protein
VLAITTFHVIAAAQTFSCLHPSPPFGSLAPQRPVTMPIAGGTAVPGGLVEHVFSPPARIEVCAQPFCRGRAAALKTLSGMQCTAYCRVRARTDPQALRGGHSAGQEAAQAIRAS